MIKIKIILVKKNNYKYEYVKQNTFHIIIKIFEKLVQRNISFKGNISLN